MNPFTKQRYSTQYKTILETRKKLPVYAKMDEFLNIVSKHSMSLYYFSQVRNEFRN